SATVSSTLPQSVPDLRPAGRGPPPAWRRPVSLASWSPGAHPPDRARVRPVPAARALALGRAVDRSPGRASRRPKRYGSSPRGRGLRESLGGAFRPRTDEPPYMRSGRVRPFANTPVRHLCPGGPLEGLGITQAHEGALGPVALESGSHDVGVHAKILGQGVHGARAAIQGELKAIDETGTGHCAREASANVESRDGDRALARLELQPERLRLPWEVVGLPAREHDGRGILDFHIPARFPDQTRAIEGEVGVTMLRPSGPLRAPGPDAG